MPLLALAASSTAAMAGQEPLYQPAPAWVVPAPPIDPAKLTADAPVITLLDFQQRIEGDTFWSYVNSATRIASPEMLTQAANFTIPWVPDKGDLTVHELAILRGSERIDLLARGQKLTVLRREQNLERLELTGVLTATTAIEGLRVGDVFQFRITISGRDAALGGRVQSATPLLPSPAQVGFGRYRLTWPTSLAPKWRVTGEGFKPRLSAKGGFSEILVSLPVAKQPEMPTDAPARFRKPPMVEVATFADWADVSRTMAPLYATKGTIVASGPIAAEIAAIMKAEPSARGRAARALQIVQDQIRYLAVGMDGGNYVPQSPTRTWEVRYGDCKAKTLLLLAMLDAMGIEAEPVLAHIGAGGMVREFLPHPGAFNHVLVRATIDGKSLWLDGTGSGTRLADLDDTPPHVTVLPVRLAGAELIDIVTRANARPIFELSIEADESASSDVPSVFEAKAVLRGPAATQLTLGSAGLGEKERRDLVNGFFQGAIGEALYADGRLIADSAAGAVTLTAKGVLTTPWYWQDRQRQRKLGGNLGDLAFEPDRARPAWAALPVMTPNPEGGVYRIRIRLPDGGKNYVLEGTPELKARLAGHDISRTARIADGAVTLEERIDATGGEIPASAIPAERDRLTTVKAQMPRVIEPTSARRRWDLAGVDPAGATQIKAADAIYAKTIAEAPDESAGFISRASFRGGIGDRKGAVADLTKAIAIEPTPQLHLQRARYYYDLGDLAAASADGEAARKRDPGSFDAITYVSDAKAERGDLAGAIAMLDERIALGGDTKNEYIEAKADMIGEFGDPATAIALLDTLIAAKPGSPSLLNARCWVKAKRAVMIDSALKDCTASIELSSNTVAALDSRAMVWFRMGRLEEALRDLDAVIADAPGIAQSRFLRAVVLKRLGRAEDAARDLAIARRIAPGIDKTNARYGITA